TEFEKCQSQRCSGRTTMMPQILLRPEDHVVALAQSILIKTLGSRITILTGACGHQPEYPLSLCSRNIVTAVDVNMYSAAILRHTHRQTKGHLDSATVTKYQNVALRHMKTVCHALKAASPFAYPFPKSPIILFILFRAQFVSTHRSGVPPD